MSGITPILDTLLHQVLGKRVDLPAARDLNEPVKPLQAGTAPQALHSDSRLDPRPAPAAPTGAKPAGGQPVAPQPPAAEGQSSASTHFSAAARDIAAVLARFPAPPSVLRAGAPLLSGGPGEAQPAELAARLKSSIDSSGLFYEAHLKRWYQGGLGREQLAREPQMARMLSQLPAAPSSGRAATENNTALPGGRVAGVVAPSAQPAAAAGTRPPERVEFLSAPPAPGRVVTVPGYQRVDPQPRPPLSAPGQSPGTAASAEAPLSPVRAETAGAAPAAGAGEASSSAAARERMPASAESAGWRADSTGHHGVGESLQGVVRHQLEMLAMPVLRWEGDVWSGLFMALTIQLPEAARRDGRDAGGESGERGDGPGEEGGAWHSELRLDVARLGEIRASFRVFQDQLALTLSTPSETLQEHLASGRDELVLRLGRCGFSEVSLQVSGGPGE